MLDLAGRHVVVSAGGTREYLDPVRYLTNASSGRMGRALHIAKHRGSACDERIAPFEIDPHGLAIS